MSEGTCCVVSFCMYLKADVSHESHAPEADLCPLCPGPGPLCRRR
jgi:hypothetical protein